MPQMKFWASQVPCSIEFHYEMDPAKPNEDGFFRITIRDQARKPISHGGCKIPVDVLWEAGDDLIKTGWGIYLFGEPDDLPTNVAVSAARWRTFARLQADRLEREAQGDAHLR